MLGSNLARDSRVTAEERPPGPAQIRQGRFTSGSFFCRPMPQKTHLFTAKNLFTFHLDRSRQTRHNLALFHKISQNYPLKIQNPQKDHREPTDSKRDDGRAKFLKHTHCISSPVAHN
jgi:hypothetical protein